MTSMDAVMREIHQKHEILLGFQAQGTEDHVQVREAFRDLKEAFRSFSTAVMEEVREKTPQIEEWDIHFASSAIKSANSSADTIEKVLGTEAFKNVEQIPQTVSTVMALASISETVQTLEMVESRLKNV